LLVALPRAGAAEGRPVLEEVAQPAAAAVEELLEDVARVDAAGLEAAAAEALMANWS
jgi:hypothetical protein